MASEDKNHIFDNPKNINRVLYVLYAACGISVLAEVFVHRHVVHEWEWVFSFYGIYGFFGIVILVLLAKELRKLVLRKEGYYDD